MELSIIIPTLNERDNIFPLVQRIEKSLRDIDWELIFVDDASTDGTPDVVKNMSVGNPRIRLIQRSGHTGLSSACIEGMKKGGAPYLAVIDADGQHDESILPAMLRELREQQLDLAIGSRYFLKSQIGQWSKIRLYISRFSTVLVRAVLKQDIKDPLSGIFMIDQKYFIKVAPLLSGRGQKILLDICLSSSQALRFKEIPFSFKGRMSGQSKLSPKIVWDNIHLLLDKLIFKRMKLIPDRL